MLCKGGCCAWLGSNHVLLADMQMLFAALLFGVGFIGQREVMVEGMGPMTCNALRFGLSAVLLALCIPFMPPNVLYSNIDASRETAGVTVGASDAAAETVEEGLQQREGASKLNGTGINNYSHSTTDEFILKQLLGHSIAQNGCCGIKRTVYFWGAFLGLLNFFGSALQQWGLVYTSASKVAFIAGFDIFLTPLLLLFMPSVKLYGQPSASTWLSVIVGILGMFLISGASISDLSIGTGELLTLLSACVWVFYLLYTDYATVQIESSVHMMTVQLGTVSVYSTIAALLYEQQDWEWHHLLPFFPWLSYMATTEGIGFLLMAMGQVYSPPTHVAIILSLEGVFAAVGSFFYLHEQLSRWEVVGCVLMLVATLIAKIADEMPCCVEFINSFCGFRYCRVPSIVRSGDDNKRGKQLVMSEERLCCGTSMCGLVCDVFRIAYSFLKDCCRKHHYALNSINYALRGPIRLFGATNTHVGCGSSAAGAPSGISSKSNSSGDDLEIFLVSKSVMSSNSNIHRTASAVGGGPITV